MKTTMKAVAVVILLVAVSAAYGIVYDNVTVDRGSLKVGTLADGFSKVTVDGLTGALKVQRVATLAVTGASRTITAVDYGKTLLLSYAGTVAITLPANGAPAGTWFRSIVIGANTTIPTYTAATTDTLIAPNDQAAKAVTFATGHRIASCVRFISTGSYWVAINENAGCTMTVTP